MLAESPSWMAHFKTFPRLTEKQRKEMVYSKKKKDGSKKAGQSRSKGAGLVSTVASRHPIGSGKEYKVSLARVS